MGNTANILVGLAAVAIGVILLLWVIPSQTVPPIFATVPPRFYPDFTTWMLIVSGGALLASGLLAPRRHLDRGRSLRQAGVFATALVLLSAATLAMPRIGYAPTGIVVAAVTVWLMGERRPVVLVAIAVVAPITIWAAFDVLLGRPLP